MVARGRSSAAVALAAAPGPGPAGRLRRLRRGGRRAVPGAAGAPWTAALALPAGRPDRAAVRRCRCRWSSWSGARRSRGAVQSGPPRAQVRGRAAAGAAPGGGRGGPLAGGRGRRRPAGAGAGPRRAAPGSAATTRPSCWRGRRRGGLRLPLARGPERSAQHVAPVRPGPRRAGRQRGRRLRRDRAGRRAPSAGRWIVLVDDVVTTGCHARGLRRGAATPPGRSRSRR